MSEPTCPCGGRCHHDTSPCSLGCWAAQKPWRPEEEYERGQAEARAEQPTDVAALRREVERLDRALTEEITERDRLIDLLDEMSWAIAPIEEIGEHTSANDPWANAIEIARERAALTEGVTSSAPHVATNPEETL